MGGSNVRNNSIEFLCQHCCCPSEFKASPRQSRKWSLVGGGASGTSWICSSKWSYAYFVFALNHASWVHQNCGFVGHCELCVEGIKAERHGHTFVCVSLFSCPQCHWVSLTCLSAKWQLWRISRWWHCNSCPCAWDSLVWASMQPRGFYMLSQPEVQKCLR